METWRERNEADDEERYNKIADESEERERDRGV